MNIEPLLAQLCDNDAEVRQQAIHLLAQMGEAIVRPLIESLKNKSDACHWGLPAVTTLSMIGEPAIVPLLEALETGDLSLQISAADGLGRIGTPLAIEPIIGILMRGSIELIGLNWRHFALCLAKIGKPAVDALIAKLYAAEDQGESRTFVNLLGFCGKAAVDELDARIETLEPDLKRKTYWALAEMAHETAFELFVRWLQDEDANVRAFGIWGLRFQNDERILDYVHPLVADTEPIVRRILAAVLGMLKGERAAAMLEVLRNDPDEQVRINAQ